MSKTIIQPEGETFTVDGVTYTNPFDDEGMDCG